jgi:ABC-type phosphate transport system ATPase subunit
MIYNDNLFLLFPLSIVLVSYIDKTKVYVWTLRKIITKIFQKENVIDNKNQYHNAVYNIQYNKINHPSKKQTVKNLISKKKNTSSTQKTWL